MKLGGFVSTVGTENLLIGIGEVFVNTGNSFDDLGPDSLKKWNYRFIVASG